MRKVGDARFALDAMRPDCAANRDAIRDLAVAGRLYPDVFVKG